MSAFLQYTDYIRSGTKLKGSLNFGLFVTQACACDSKTRQLSVKWAKKQINFDFFKVIDAFLDNYLEDDKVDNYIDFLKCLSAEFEKISTQKALSMHVLRKVLTVGFRTCSKKAIKIAKLMGELFSNDLISELHFDNCFRRIMFCLNPVDRKMLLAQAMFSPIVMKKFKDSRARETLLFWLKGYSVFNFTLNLFKTLDSKHMKQLIAGLIKLDILPKNAHEFDKPEKIQKAIIDFGEDSGDLKICSDSIQQLELTLTEEFLFLGGVIFNVAVIDVKKGEKLVTLIKHLNQNVFDKIESFMHIIRQSIVKHGVVPSLEILELKPETLATCLKMYDFIACLFKADVIDHQLVYQCIDMLYILPTNSKSSDPMELKKMCLMRFYSAVSSKLPDEHLVRYSELIETINEVLRDDPAILQSIAEMSEDLHEFYKRNRENSDNETQQAATQPKTSKKLKSKKNLKNPGSVTKTCITFSIDEVEDIEKLKAIAALLNNESKLEAFIKAILQKPSTDPRNISSVVKLIENLNSIYETTTESCIDFASVLNSALDQVFVATKESKLDEETKTKTARLAIIYAEAYKLNLVSNSKFTAFLHQKRLKELSVDILAKMSSSIGTRLHSEPSVKVQKAAENLENLIKAAQKANFQAIHKGLDALSDLLDDLF